MRKNENIFSTPPTKRGSKKKKGIEKLNGEAVKVSGGIWARSGGHLVDRLELSTHSSLADSNTRRSKFMPCESGLATYKGEKKLIYSEPRRANRGS